MLKHVCILRTKPKPSIVAYSIGKNGTKKHLNHLQYVKSICPTPTGISEMLVDFWVKETVADKQWTTDVHVVFAL